MQRITGNTSGKASLEEGLEDLKDKAKKSVLCSVDKGASLKVSEG